MSISADVRKALAVFARCKATRTTIFTKQQPTEWRPYEVTNQTDTANFIPYFSDDSAWNFIADLLEKDHEVETVNLENPPGITGYVMHIETTGGQPRIYVKLQLGNGAVIGRSFHYDT
jgi:uncharacterized protein (DUF1684 family)